MKKVLSVILVIFILIILISNKEENTRFVMDYDESYNDNIYLLDFSEENLSTNNFKLKIAPFMGYSYIIRKIEPKYNSELKKYYTYDFRDIDVGIDKFKIDYINILRKNNLHDEIEKTYKNGIEISTVEIYSTKEALIKFLKKYPKVKYEIIPSNYESL